MGTTSLVAEFRRRALAACLHALAQLASGDSYSVDDLAAGAIALDLTRDGVENTPGAVTAAKDLRLLADLVVDPHSRTAQAFASWLADRVKTFAVEPTLH